MPERAARKNLDFTNVKDKGPYNPKRKQAGDYKAKVTAVEDVESSKGNPMWVFALQLTVDASAVYPERCVLTEKSLWKLRNLLQAAGLQVPKKKVAVDPNKIVGKFIGVTLTDGEYEGKEKSEVEAVFPASELTSDSPDGDGADDDEDLEDSTGDDDEEVEDELEVDEL